MDGYLREATGIIGHNRLQLSSCFQSLVDAVSVIRGNNSELDLWSISRDWIPYSCHCRTNGHCLYRLERRPLGTGKTPTGHPIVVTNAPSARPQSLAEKHGGAR